MFLVGVFIYLLRPYMNPEGIVKLKTAGLDMISIQKKLTYEILVKMRESSGKLHPMIFKQNLDAEGS